MGKRLRYEEIEAGWGMARVVAGYEVCLPGGWCGVGETLDDAVRAAELARGTHMARVERLRDAARSAARDRDAGLRAQHGGKRPDQEGW